LDILCPPAANSPETSGSPIVLRNALGTRMARNRRLEKKDLEFLKEYDWILSVNNFGARALSEVKTEVVRHIHTVAHDRPVSSYLSLNAGLMEYSKMVIQRGRERSAEVLLSSTKTFCVSQYNASKMVQYGLEAKSNIHQLPNGIDTSRFKPAVVEKKYELLFIGRFQKLKGLDILLSTFAILQKRGRKPRLAVAGNFNSWERVYCQKLVPEECRSSLNFVGTIPHEQIPDLINASRFLVVPSRYESFSLPTLEAQACGIPIIGSSVGGLPELLDENTGILLKSLSAEELASEIEKALDSGVLGESALKFGPQKAAPFNNHLLARRFENLLTNG
jgi:glycosyltransferase involved in cell wall biosynthesis